MPRRLLAGAVVVILATSLVLGTAAWLGTWDQTQSAVTGLTGWVSSWAAFSVWAALLTVPAVLLLALPLDLATRRLPTRRAVLAFAGLGFVVGAIAGFAIVESVGPGWLGAMVLGPLGALGGALGRLAADRLVRTDGLLTAATALTVALVVLGAIVD